MSRGNRTQPTVQCLTTNQTKARSKPLTSSPTHSRDLGWEKNRCTFHGSEDLNIGGAPARALAGLLNELVHVAVCVVRIVVK